MALVLGMVAGCSPSPKGTASKESSETKIVASTSWVAAMAKAAGAQNVRVLAPVDLKHPPEYDFKPSDVQSIIEADWIIMAGYEPFMNQMLEANDVDEEKIIKVSTTNTIENLKEQTKLIAEKIGTEEAQAKWDEEFTIAYNSILEKAKNKGVKNTKVLVQMHLQAFVKALGFDVLEAYSADELTPAKIGELAKLNPDLIIDNYHNPQGQPIAEATGVDRIEIRNFPGEEHKDLIDLFIDNAKKLGIE